MPPFFRDDPDPEKSLFLLLANLNKRGVTLDLDAPEGAELFRRLARDRRCDRGEFCARLSGFARAGSCELAQDNPGLVMTSITPFGQTGPYRHFKGSEIVAYATSGIMAISGTTDREPLQHGGFPALYEAAMNGMLATNVALLTRDLGGAGQHVDVSIQEVVASSLVLNQPLLQLRRRRAGTAPSGRQFVRPGNALQGRVLRRPAGRRRHLGRHRRLLRPRGTESTRASPIRRNACCNGHELDAIMLDATKDRTMAEMFTTASEQYRMLLGIVQTPEDLANCQQLGAREYYQEVDHPVIGGSRSHSACGACRPATPPAAVPLRCWASTTDEFTARARLLRRGARRAAGTAA